MGGGGGGREGGREGGADGRGYCIIYSHSNSTWGDTLYISKHDIDVTPITLVYFSSRINYNNILKLLALLKQLCYYYLGCYTNIHSHNKIIVLDLSQNSIIN